MIIGGVVVMIIFSLFSFVIALASAVQVQEDETDVGAKKRLVYASIAFVIFFLAIVWLVK